MNNSKSPDAAHILEELDLAEHDLARSTRRLRSLLHTLGAGDFRKQVESTIKQITKLMGEVQGLAEKLEPEEQEYMVTLAVFVPKGINEDNIGLHVQEALDQGGLKWNFTVDGVKRKD